MNKNHGCGTEGMAMAWRGRTRYKGSTTIWHGSGGHKHHYEGVSSSSDPRPIVFPNQDLAPRTESRDELGRWKGG